MVSFSLYICLAIFGLRNVVCYERIKGHLAVSFIGLLVTPWAGKSLLGANCSARYVSPSSGRSGNLLRKSHTHRKFVACKTRAKQEGEEDEKHERFVCLLANLVANCYDEIQRGTRLKTVCKLFCMFISCPSFCCFRTGCELTATWIIVAYPHWRRIGLLRLNACDSKRSTWVEFGAHYKSNWTHQMWMCYCMANLIWIWNEILA